LTFPGIAFLTYNFSPYPFAGTTLCQNNDIIRCGGMFYGAQYGAFEPGPSSQSGNTITSSTYRDFQ
jgi:hypothetical protein